MHHNGSHIYPRSRPSWCAWPVGRQTRMSFSSRDSLLLAAPFSQHGSWVLSTLKPGCSLPRPLGKRSIHSVMERVRKGPQRSPGLASLLKQDGRRAHGTDCIQWSLSTSTERDSTPSAQPIPVFGHCTGKLPPRTSCAALSARLSYCSAPPSKICLLTAPFRHMYAVLTTSLFYFI